MAEEAKPRTYSWSKFDAFRKCPWAFKKIYQEKVGRAESDPLITGRVTHKTIAEYLMRLISLGLQTDWEWANNIRFEAVPDDVAYIWEQFWASFILPPIQNPGVEKKLAFNRHWEPTDYDGPDTYFRMVLDLVFRQDHLLVVDDWKTNWIVPGTIEKDFQTRLYGWGARAALYPDVQEVLLRLNFLRFGIVREVHLYAEDLDNVPQEIAEKIAEIEAEEYFSPKPGNFCSWCGVQDHCPNIAQALVPREIIAPTSLQEAHKAAKLLLAIQALNGVLSSRLKGFVETFGPLQVGDLNYGPVPSVNYEMDPKTITDQLIDLGVPRETVWAALNISKTSINSALSKGGYKGKRKGEREAILEAVLGACPSQETSTIKFHKQGEE